MSLDKVILCYFLLILRKCQICEMISLSNSKNKTNAGETKILKQLHCYTIYTRCLTIVWSNNLLTSLLHEAESFLRS
jgi:hypothetical protein